jgi:hypothetical protein
MGSPRTKWFNLVLEDVKRRGMSWQETEIKEERRLSFPLTLIKQKWRRRKLILASNCQCI